MAQAYQLAGVGTSGDLLAPAYHCVTMLDPALNLGANIRLYPLLPDLTPDLATLEEMLEKPDNPVKGLLATHFFGFAQDFEPLKKWCSSHDIAMIEDCSHILFTEKYQASGTGKTGRFVSASPYKFFACEDGGLLHCQDETLLREVMTKPSSLRDELQAVKHGIDKYRSSTAQKFEIDRIDKNLDELCIRPAWPASEQNTSSWRPSIQFSADKTQTMSLRSSRLIVGLSSIEALANPRKRNYQRWLDGMVGLPNCRPLYPDLPESCIPYMFPLLIDYPEPHFFWLKHLGVPIWRWDEMAVSDCPVASDYRLHLLHLPCHQSLSAEQINWMIAAVEKTLRRPVQGVV